MPTLEWYTEVGASVVPIGDWNAEYEPGGAISHQIVGLSPGHAYLFRVRAINSAGVRSEWSTQLSLIIPTQPLVQTSGIALGAATEVIQTNVVNDTFTTGVFGAEEHWLGQTEYTNDTGDDVDIEISLTSQRRVTTPASASLLDVLSILSVIQDGSVLVGPTMPFPVVNHIEDMGPSEARLYNEAVGWTLVLADGHSIEAKSVTLISQGAYSGVLLDTTNLNLRMTIVKR